MIDKIITIVAIIFMTNFLQTQSNAEETIIDPPPAQVDEYGYFIVSEDYNSQAGCAFVSLYRQHVSNFVKSQKKFKMISHINEYGTDIYYFDINTRNADIQFETSIDKMFVDIFDISGNLILNYMNKRNKFIKYMRFKQLNLSRYDFMCDYDNVNVFLDRNKIIRIRVENRFFD